MSNDYPSRENISIPTTGDPARDQEIIDGFLRSDRRRAEGMCPNGCGPMVFPAPHLTECPKCGFHMETFVLRY